LEQLIARIGIGNFFSLPRKHLLRPVARTIKQEYRAYQIRW